MELPNIRVITIVWSNDEVEVDWDEEQLDCAEAFWLLHQAANIVLNLPVGDEDD